MEISTNKKHSNGSLEEAIKKAEDLRDIKILNLPIGGGTGAIIKEAFVGTEDSFWDFVESIKEDLDGWTYIGDFYTLPWHEGEFIDVMNSYEDTLSQMGEEAIKEFEEQKVVIWRKEFNEYFGDDADEDIYVYGIYRKERKND